MADVTVSFYERGETRYATGRLIERHPAGRVTVETENGTRLTGMRVPDHLAALAGGAVVE